MSGDDSSSVGGTTTAAGRSDLLDRVLGIEHGLLDTLFTLVLLAFAVVFTVLSLGYSENARLVPLLVLVVMFVLLAAVLAIQRSDRVAAYFEQQSSSLQDKFDTTEDAADVETDLPTMRVSAIKILVWMVLLLGVIYVAGHIVGIFVFLLFIYWEHGEQSIGRALVYSLINTLFIYFVFRVGLNARLYDGLLGLRF